MDLEAATRAFVAAVAASDATALGALVAPEAVFEVAKVPGRFTSRKVVAFVARRGRPVRLTVTDLAVKRNVVFAQLHLDGGAGADGTLVLSWNQDGQVVHGTMHAELLAWRAAWSA